jgi:spore germination cell wall hydrolase CwlJ-like protein
MKKLVASVMLAGAMIVAAHAEGKREPSAPAAAARPGTPADWSAWTRPLGNKGAAPVAAAAPRPLPAEAPLDDVDVVDAHWMALTMWGEGRGEGEEGMRAVGHVIRNRWLAQRHGAHVTDTVSEAWQFSCWNAGDPNQERMLNIEGLSTHGADYRLWLDAKRLAAEILAGRSTDPTGGALFYHSTGVQPRWSSGIAPVTRIGSHLFFRAAR